MKNVNNPSNLHYQIQHRKTIRLALAVLAPLLMLLAACIPQIANNPSPSITPTPTTTPQTASPTVSIKPTTTTQSEGTIDRTVRPTPELVDEPVMPTSGTPVVGEVPLDMLDAIIADLAESLDISAEEITVVQAREVEWNDGSLGCPQPGMMYIQVITPGFRVVLLAKDQMFDYHTDTNTRFILCNGYGVINDPVPLLPIRPGGNKSPKCKWPPCR